MAERKTATKGRTAAKGTRARTAESNAGSKGRTAAKGGTARTARKK